MKQRLGLAAAVLGLTLGAAGRAEALIALEPFNASGTFSDGSMLGGTLYITELGPLSSVSPASSLTITGGNIIGTETFNVVGAQSQIDSLTYEVTLSGTGGSLTLEIEDGGSLASYNGGLLNSYNGVVNNPDPNAPATSYTLTASDPPLSMGSLAPAAVPEPSTIILAGIGGLMCLGYAWRRRKRAATACGSQ
jgi:hypothetical protein